MAIAFRAASNVTNNSSAAITVNKPTGTLQFDVLLAWFYVDLTTTVSAAPSGWVLVDNIQETTNSYHTYVYRLVCGGSEPASYTWTLSSSVYNEGIILGFSGVDNTTPVDVHGIADRGSTSSITTPSLTTTVSGDALVACLVCWQGNGGASAQNSYTLPTNGQPSGADTWVEYLLGASQGAVGNNVFSCTTAGGAVAALVALKPASSGATLTRTVPASVALLATQSRSVPSSVSLLGTSTRTIPTTAALLATKTRTVTATAALLGTATRTIPSSASLLGTATRTIPTTVALSSAGTNSRTVAASVALKATVTRTVPSSVALLATNQRTIPASVALNATFTRTVTASVALKSSPVRSIPTTVALSGPATRTIPASIALLATQARSVPSSVALAATLSRTLPASAALNATLTRTVTSSAALKATLTRTIPATVALFAQSFAGALKGSFTSVPRLSGKLSPISRLSASFLSGSRFKSSFVRSVTMAQPYSTTDVTATILKFDNSVPTAQTLVVAVTFPDGTTQSFSLAGGTVTSLGGGQYRLTYTTGGVGPHREVWIFTATDGSVGEFENVTYASF